ncbi:S26 family signal peptidase [Dinoroseobacter sp. PD6]|uniref:S26 family signal peptidase n=1 Tax=Dinoroseobacter sp. PD6 TaxID=3028384 RepID=UPI00237A6808|nr:S26 family signal peptidase [Dinoroseobacter sp. PD6]MDD9718699.1 S26 family signal peptidase [Dinoroseobacter sp. PD6]
MTARSSIAWTTVLSVTLIALPAVATWSPRVLWNASASVPVGLYRLHSVGHLTIGDLVAVQSPPALSDYLDARGYLPSGVPLLKHVVALEGALVCRSSDRITVDHRRLGQAHAQDRYGRDLPVWQGCHRLGAGEVFLMNPEAPDSLDGRYFGPLPRSAITARLTPLWTVSDGRTAEAAHPESTPHRNRKEARHAPDR